MTDSFYEEDNKTALEAQRHAQEIAFAPIVFQVSRLMKKFGLLQKLLEAGDRGMTLKTLASTVRRPAYGVQLLLESSLSIGLVIQSADRFRITKTGVCLLNDRSVGVNMEFIHHVCYRGLFHLEEAMDQGVPTGLKTLGPWRTIYEGLSELSPDVRKAWFDFDHLYSDQAFDDAYSIVFARPPTHLLDIGGNTGKWAAKCVGQNPDVRVTVLDLPSQLSLLCSDIENVSGRDRIFTCEGDILAEETVFPEPFDTIWMSQFLDCFSEEQVLRILSRIRQVMGPDSVLWIMETFWDRQRFETATFCINQASVYFAALANGKSKFFHSQDLIRCIRKSNLQMVSMHDHLGLGHTLLRVERGGE